VHDVADFCGCAMMGVSEALELLRSKGSGMLWILAIVFLISVTWDALAL
jgi:hypothetical protein